MKTVKIVWKVGDEPTGRYRSFQHRSWPVATFGRDGPMAAMLVPVEPMSYSPHIAETTELRIKVADYSMKDESFTWRRLKATVIGVTAAKELYLRFLASNPTFDHRQSRDT